MAPGLDVAQDTTLLKVYLLVGNFRHGMKKGHTLWHRFWRRRYGKDILFHLPTESINCLQTGSKISEEL